MPRYFFHLANHALESDEDGTDLAGPAEAWVEAVRFAGAYVRDRPGLVDGDRLRVRVTDSAGDQVLAVSVEARWVHPRPVNDAGAS